MTGTYPAPQGGASADRLVRLGTGGLVIIRHPYRAVGAVLAVMAALLFVSGMIGQYNDGPWGGLPEWLSAATWFGFLGTVLVLLMLSAYLAAANVRFRRAVG